MGGGGAGAGGGGAGGGGAGGGGAGMGACGTERLPTMDITDTEGLAIAADGTVYFSQSEAIGRRRPGGAVERTWVTITGASTVWGVAVSADGRTVYAVSPSTNQLYKVDATAAAPTAQRFASIPGSPNGLTLGADGTAWVTAFDTGIVYHVDATGNRTTVTSTPIASANGLLFEPAGTLLVVSYANGDIVRLTLAADGSEMSRTRVGGITGGSLDGIARDASGRIYVTDNGAGALIRLSASFDAPETLAMRLPSAANIAFGKGALGCNDVYVAASGFLGFYQGDQPGSP